MTTIISGSSPSITFSDSTTQTTAFTSTPSVTSITTSADASIHGLTVGLGAGAVSNNTAVGASALSGGSLSGGRNIGIGINAGNTISTGAQNTFVGSYCGTGITTGTQNIGIGDGAMTGNSSNATGSYNVGVGALTALTSGANNVGVGYQALNANTIASNNTAVGYQALYKNTSGLTNVAMGYLAGYSNTTAGENTYIGQSAGQFMIGGPNTAIGSYALNNYGGTAANGTGTNNNAFGKNAMLFNTSGSFNVSIGDSSLFTNTTASYNTIVGFEAGKSLNGGNNVMIGYQAGQNGYGYGSSTGTNNILIGYQATVGGGNTDSNEIVITTRGNAVSGKGSNTGYIDANGGGVYQGNNSAAWSITSDQRLKKNIVDNTDGLDKIIQIKVRNFEYRTEDEVTDLPKNQAIKKQGVQLGVIAQELQQVLPDCVKQESTGVLAVDSTDIMYHMINAIKELNAKITALEAKLGA